LIWQKWNVKFLTKKTAFKFKSRPKNPCFALPTKTVSLSRIWVLEINTFITKESASVKRYHNFRRLNWRFLKRQCYDQNFCII
jgi:hypothetical protein